jgi:hypothetical protein
MLVIPLSSRNTLPLSRRPLQVLEQKAHIWIFRPVMTTLCEVPQERESQGAALTPDPKKMLAVLCRHAELHVIWG